MEPVIQGDFKRLYERVLVLIGKYSFIKLNRNSKRYTACSLASFDGGEKFMNSSAEFSSNVRILLALKFRNFIFLGGNEISLSKIRHVA